MSTSFAERYGPWAMVTGASSGIGRQFALLLAERGINVVVAARRKDRLESLAAQMASNSSVQVQVLELDLAAPGFLETMLSATADKDVGLVVSNAGFGYKGLYHLQERSRLDGMLNVNILAPTLIAHAYAPKLIQRGRGGVLITGSVEGFLGMPWSAAYSASKAYVHTLGEALWGELRPRGVDVLVLAPGATDTEAAGIQGLDPNQFPNLMSPREVAQMALDRLGHGPIYVPGAINRAMVRFLTLLPRRSAITMAGKGTKAAIDKAASRQPS
jgi:uncharacterized protein